MINMNSIFHKALQDDRTNEKYGVRYQTHLFEGVPESYVDRALDHLDPEEMKKLLYLQNEGVSIEIIRSGGGEHGFWRQSDKVVGLSVSPRGRFKKGTIVHEAKHYEQWKEGRLSTTGSDYRLWEGEQVRNAERSVQYFRLPWEQEAFRAEAEFLSSRGLRIPASVRMWWWEKGYVVNPSLEKLSKKTLFPSLVFAICLALITVVTLPFSSTLTSGLLLAFVVSPPGQRTIKEQLRRFTLESQKEKVLRGATPRRHR